MILTSKCKENNLDKFVRAKQKGLLLREAFQNNQEIVCFFENILKDVFLKFGIHSSLIFVNLFYNIFSKVAISVKPGPFLCYEVEI